MQTENSIRNLCQKIYCMMQTENSNRNLENCIMQTEIKKLVFCKLKTVTQVCVKNKLYYAN